jgi:hypothetical protein
VIGVMIGGAAAAAAVAMATSQARHANARAMAADRAATRKSQTAVGGTASAPVQQATVMDVYPSGHPYASPPAIGECVLAACSII